jgi:hypothetical protein
MAQPFNPMQDPALEPACLLTGAQQALLAICSQEVSWAMDSPKKYRLIGRDADTGEVVLVRYFNESDAKAKNTAESIACNEAPFFRQTRLTLAYNGLDFDGMEFQPFYQFTVG